MRHAIGRVFVGAGHNKRSEAPPIMSDELSNEDREILETIRDNGFTASAWVDSDSILELTGPGVSLRIPQDTAERLSPYVQFAPSGEQPRRLFSLSAAGEQALAQEAAPAGIAPR